jgi:DNA repair exonuclease SbcCD ATPase subunit
MSIQNGKNNISFIDLGNTERKDLLVQFIGLNIFDRLHEVADKKSKEINTVLKLHRDKNYSQDLIDAQNNLSQSKSTFKVEEQSFNELQEQKNEVNEKIVEETKKLIKLDSNVPSNLKDIENRKIQVDKDIQNLNRDLSVLETSEKTKRELIDNIETEINKIEASKLVESHKIFKDLSNKIRDVQQQMELKKVEVRSKLDKLEKLKEHKYDPKCKFCMDNIFVKDAIATKSKLEEDKKETDKLLATLNDLQKEIKKYEWVDGAYQKYTKLLNDKSNIKDEYDKVTKNIILTKNHLGKQLESHKLIVNQFESYHKNEISIQNNETVNSNISKLRMNLNSLTINIQKYNKVLMELSGKVTLYESQIEKLKSTIEEVKKLEESYTLYELYLSSVGRDGIPHEVIYCTVPEIEREVNSILSQIVEFTISFENDGKNISPYIVYDSRSWAAEMSSGFERFVSSIAIRVALTNISNLPKSTFLVIDEGFGTLDGNNLPSMNSLFTFLKSNFDFILIISHLDSMKDMVDKTIEIKRDGNFSKVIYE